MASRLTRTRTYARPYAYAYAYVQRTVRNTYVRSTCKARTHALRALALPRKGRRFARCSRRDRSPRPALSCAASLSARARVRPREPHRMTDTRANALPVCTRDEWCAPHAVRSRIPTYAGRHRGEKPRTAIKSSAESHHAS